MSKNVAVVSSPRSAKSGEDRRLELSCANTARARNRLRNTLSSSATMISRWLSPPLAKIANRGVSGASSCARVTMVTNRSRSSASDGGASATRSREKFSSDVIGG
jgi:hypothetical protein